ncbi:MAG: NADH:ubiquinone oxidoreductase subunit NDUFA12 [Hyphomicrobiales bacterium]|nr:MAG: NADH:ubiquinone oxidoreductase subunit NDUFA12 [Hyphomicrobiales bacterium]
MMGILSEIFTWWNGQTIGTRFFTWKYGVKVGEDQVGNQYYKQKSGPKRWVTYNGYVEATRVPPGWHAWLHHTVDIPPSEEEYEAKPWEDTNPQANMTGTTRAYRPQGSILGGGSRAKVSGDYDAWSPEK